MIFFSFKFQVYSERIPLHAVVFTCAEIFAASAMLLIILCRWT